MARNARVLSLSFAGGEMSPEMFGRLDDRKFQAGAARIRNMICKPQGPLRRRPGFRFVREVKDSSKQVRLIPFQFSPEQSLAIEVGEGYFRFHTQAGTLAAGTPPAYVVSQTATFDAGTDVMTWAAGHGLLEDDPIVITVAAGQNVTFTNATPGKVNLAGHGLASGTPILFAAGAGTLPAQLVAGTVYYVSNSGLGANDFEVSATRGGASLAFSGSAGTCQLGAWPGASGLFIDPDDTWYVDVTGPTTVKLRQTVGGATIDLLHAGYGTLTGHRLYAVADLVERRGTITAVDTGTETITAATAHGLLADDRVRFLASGGGLPAGISEGVGYWVIAAGLTATAFRVSTTQGGAAVDLGAGFAGAPIWSHGTPAQSRNYYCLQAHTDVKPPTFTHWYGMPGDGTYEVPNPFLEAQLFDLQYVQSNDILTLVHQEQQPAELRRYDVTRWIFAPIAFGSSLPAPTGVAVTPTKGQGLRVTAVTAATPAVLTTTTNHLLQEAIDAVEVVGVGDIPDGIYVVGTSSTTSLRLKQVESGENVGSTTTTVTAASRVRPTSLSSESSNSYVVTALADDGSESPASAEASADNNLFVSGASNSISWTAVLGAQRYRVYKKQTGLFGYIGEVDATVATAFEDDNIAPDLGITPPIIDVSLSGTDYPGAVGYFEQRRCFAGSPLEPQKLWMTRSSSESDLSYSIPVRDSDRIAIRVAAREQSTITHIVPLGHLLLLTSSTELRVTPLNSDALTPASISVRPQSYIGASRVQPSIVNNTAVFAAARGGHVHEMGFREEVGGYFPGDLSLRAAHLFDGLEIVQQAYAKAPVPVLWFVSSAGKLLGLTYVPEEAVGAWHQHDTDGTFESATTVLEGAEDVLYVVVRRTIGGTPKRYIEVMAPQQQAELAAAFHVDSGLSYDGAAVTVVTGLSHLEGKTVAVLADGVVQAQRTVTGGQITLSPAASKVSVGLPVTAELLTLPLALQIDGAGTSRVKNIAKVAVRVFESGNFLVGSAAAANLESAGLAAGQVTTKPVEVNQLGEWSDDGQVLLQQADPLPLTVVGLTLEVAVGG